MASAARRRDRVEHLTADLRRAPQQCSRRDYPCKNNMALLTLCDINLTIAAAGLRYLQRPGHGRQQLCTGPDRPAKPLPGPPQIASKTNNVCSEVRSWPVRLRQQQCAK